MLPLDAVIARNTNIPSRTGKRHSSRSVALEDVPENLEHCRGDG